MKKTDLITCGKKHITSYIKHLAVSGLSNILKDKKHSIDEDRFFCIGQINRESSLLGLPYERML